MTLKELREGLVVGLEQIDGDLRLTTSLGCPFNRAPESRVMRNHGCCNYVSRRSEEPWFRYEIGHCNLSQYFSVPKVIERSLEHKVYK
jgi:hypothetical protein